MSNFINVTDQILSLPADAQFGVTFIKKDGTKRPMRARKSPPADWTPSESGKGLNRQQLLERGLLLVTDCVTEEWRTIPLTRILVFKPCD